MIKLPAYFTGFRSKSDGSAGLTFATQELNAEDFAGFKLDHNAFGWLMFKPNDEIGIEEVPEESAQEDGLSTSERLRRIMYVYWKQKVNEGDFNTWRAQQMEKLIDGYKAKLD